MFVVIGLGNPGARYAGTRHNVGFQVVDCLAARYGAGAFKKWKSSEVWRGTVEGDDVLLAKPTTYMNLSGNAVHAIMAFYKASLDRLIVVHDDLDFDPGLIRVKSGGGHGGHNGLRSIIDHLGHQFTRVRVGIGKPPATSQGADYVLSRFDSRAQRLLDEAAEDAADAIEMVIRGSVQAAMNRFNRKVPQDGTSSS